MHTYAQYVYVHMCIYVYVTPDSFISGNDQS